LIHRSDAFPDLEYARVVVTFHEIVDDETHPDNYEVRRVPREISFTSSLQVVPDSEIVVARTARTNNESKYYLNSHAVAFKVACAAFESRVRSHSCWLCDRRCKRSC
jgi:chromosome segregation ATPase